MDYLDLTSGPFGLVHKLLEKYKDELGDYYPTLRPLVSALFFVVILAIVLAVPFFFFEDYKYIAFMQMVLVGVYYLSLLSWKGGYLDRFVFCLVMLAVTAAAPTLLTGDRLVTLLEEAAPPGFPTGADLPRLEFFFYSMLRGAANVLWALPALFFAFTFYPDSKAGRTAEWDRRLTIATQMGLLIQLVVSLAILSRSGILGVIQAPIDAALPLLQEKIDGLRSLHVTFTVAYLGLGLVAALLIGRWARFGDSRLLLRTVVGILLVQGCFSVSISTGYELFCFYPSARADRQLVEVFRADDGQVAFLNHLTERISASKLAGWQAFSTCRRPDSYQFEVEISSRSDFEEQFPHPRIIEDIRTHSPRELFCQPTDP